MGLGDKRMVVIIIRVFLERYRGGSGRIGGKIMWDGFSKKVKSCQKYKKSAVIDVNKYGRQI
jgi:hypothetical protein